MNKTVSIEEATALLLKGGVGVIPTDTVYGLVARAADKQAVARLYALKKREHKPGTVIAASVEQLVELGVEEELLRRAEHLWPNPVSVETPMGDNLAYMHQGTGREGLRVVADKQVRHVLEQTGPLVTSSANQPGEPGSSTVDEARAYFGDQIDFYVEGGNLSGRPPSTIVRLTDQGIEVVRQGAVKVRL
jgi:tRNA threonylcarbamoyl adenosine modification protein (Sua5/YciO/YrdC/YwlC family)